MSLYLWLNIFTFSTFFLSFDKKVAFYKKFIPLLCSIIILMMIFIPWDIYFTSINVWGFNSLYISDFKIFNLPIEEWLFFITVPYSCVFIHHVLLAYFKNPFKKMDTTLIWRILSIILIVMAIINNKQYYTLTSCLLSGITVLTLTFINQFFLKQFLFTYLVCLIPFTVINGILTGSFIEQEVVWYNNRHFSGIRFLTIPIEDFAYNLLMLVSCTYFTHYFSNHLKLFDKQIILDFPFKKDKFFNNRR